MCMFGCAMERIYFGRIDLCRIGFG